MVSVPTPVMIATEASGDFLSELEDEMIMDFGNISAKSTSLETFGCMLALLFMI